MPGNAISSHLGSLCFSYILVYIFSLYCLIPCIHLGREVSIAQRAILEGKLNGLIYSANNYKKGLFWFQINFILFARDP